MSRINIFTEAEKEAFDTPPLFSQQEQELFFQVDKTLSSIIEQLGHSINQVGFLLQFGYFKATGRFFSPARFSRNVIEYIKVQLNLSDEINFTQYKGRTLRRHQARICDYFQYTMLDQAEQKRLSNIITSYVKKCIQPKKIIFSIVQQYRQEHIVLPSFDKLSKMISNAYHDYEQSKLTIIASHLNQGQQSMLEELMPIKGRKPYQRAKLIGIKHLNQSTRANKIKQSAKDFSVIQRLYQQLVPIIKALDLTPQAVQYYAGWVHKARAAQIKQFPTPAKRYLHLITFIMHQYHQYQDTFANIYLKSVQAMLSRTERKKSQAYYLSRNERNEAAHLLVKDRGLARRVLQKIKAIGLSTNVHSETKVKRILELVDEAETSTEDHDMIKNFEEQLAHAQQDGEHFDQLEASSIGLQRKLKPILLNLDIDQHNVNHPLMKAILYFKNKKGEIDESAPNEFLTISQKKHLYTDQGKWRISLYKVLLFIAVSNAIKSGELTITASYHHRNLDDYLLNEADWQSHLSEFLNKYNLDKVFDIEQLLQALKRQLDQRYKETNQHIQSGKNRHVHFNKQNEIVVMTPKVEKPDATRVSELLKPYRYTSVLEVLHTIDASTAFTDCFTHYSVKHSKSNPTPQTLFAGIIALGCNIGATKIANTSKGVNLNTLNHAITWHFSLENINTANTAIVNLIHNLPLPNIFKKDQELLHTSSDGQKKGISVDSLNANYSFKYYGHGQGVSIYTFIDERCALLYSTAISSSEREAAYVIDGLLHNDTVKSHIHSTDTHGFSEIIFAIMYLLGISFAPRLARLKHQMLYCLSPKQKYKTKNYKINPDKKIDADLIKTHWKTILRLIGSIKAKKTTASKILKRLSSYAIENPLYKALREFGRIIKTLFILTYVDDLELRQKIQKQLNKVELSNRFSNAVFFANNQEFAQSIKEDQDIAISCKRLIQNAIVLWNYLALSTKITACETEEEKYVLMNVIQHGSILTWEHINMHGEYDFLLYANANDTQFNIETIKDIDTNMRNFSKK